MASLPAATNLRPSAIDEILGRGKQIFSQASSTVSSTLSNSFTPASGSYILSVLFYIMLYGFGIFIVLVLVHYTYTPVFRFLPGQKGIIGVPGSSDDKVYWNNRKQPLPASSAPLEDDSIASYTFDNNFTVSLDILIRKLPEQSANSRLILAKAAVDSSFKDAEPSTEQDLKTFMKDKSSMIMYLSETNDLNVVFFSNGAEYASSPIKNIPLYTPFRITIVAEEKTFTVYLNGKQTFQRILPSSISASSANQRFFSPPSWTEQPSKTIFIQNLHLWPRAISSTAVAEAVPALATVSDFDAPKEVGGGTCF